MTAPFFSIIIPIYKVEAYLRQCVDSVLSQSFRDFEVILVDDGSPDGCPAICDEYAAADPRIHVIHKPNGGLSDARNAGLRQARGSYIMFLDSDDYWCSYSLLNDIFLRSQQFHEDIILFGCKIISENGSEDVTRSNYNYAVLNRHNKSISLENLFDSNNFPGAAWIYAISRKIIETKKLRFKLGVTAEDYEWIIASMIEANQIGAIEGVQYAYIRRANSITSKARFSGILGMKNAFDYYLTTKQRFTGIDKFLSRILLLALMSLTNLPQNDRAKAKAIIKDYTFILKDAGFRYYYYFIKILGLSLASYAVKLAYKIVR